MGTDIHFAVEKKEHGHWKRVMPPDDYSARDPFTIEQYHKAVAAQKADAEIGSRGPFDMNSYYIRKYHDEWFDMRTYYTFAILADVRNGSGFAGCKTGEGFKPVAKPRGLPDDLSAELRLMHNEEGFFGYHDFSWLTVKELLDYDWNQTTVNCGVIGLEEFKERLEKKITAPPPMCSGEVGGPNVLTYEEPEAKRIIESPLKEDVFPVGKNIFVRIYWHQVYKDCADWFHDRVLPELAKIDPEHPEDVRIVIGFDS